MKEQQIVPVSLETTYRMVNHGPLVLVSTADAEGVGDAAAVAWSCSYSKKPPRFILRIGRRHKTFQNIQATGELAINIPTVDFVKETVYLGTVSGNDRDKLREGGVETMPGKSTRVPLLKGCAAWIECRLIDRDLMENKELVLAEAVGSMAVEGFLREEDNTVDVARFPTLHHLGGNTFTQPGAIVSLPVSAK